LRALVRRRRRRPAEDQVELAVRDDMTLAWTGSGIIILAGLPGTHRGMCVYNIEWRAAEWQERPRLRLAEGQLRVEGPPREDQLRVLARSRSPALRHDPG
jgi:hypothetical protein